MYIAHIAHNIRCRTTQVTHDTRNTRDTHYAQHNQYARYARHAINRIRYTQGLHAPLNTHSYTVRYAHGDALLFTHYYMNRCMR